MAIYRSFFLIGIQTFLWVFSFGQTYRSDSLEQKLRSAEGTSRVDLLNRLTWQYITHDNDKVIRFNAEALSLGRKIGYENGVARAYTYKGVYEYMSGQFPEAHADLHAGLTLARKTGDRQLEGYTLLQLGNCSLEEVREDSALLFFRKSYDILKDSSDAVSLSKLYRNMSALYGQRYQPDSQQYFLDRAIRIRRLLPDNSLLTEALILKANIALRNGDVDNAEDIIREAESYLPNAGQKSEGNYDILHLKALMLFQRGDVETARTLSDSARQYYFKANLFRKYVTVLIDEGRLFRERGRYELALNNLYDALKLSRLKGFDVEATIIRNEIGWVNFHLGDLQTALMMAEESLKSGRDRMLLTVEADALMLQGVVQIKLGMYALARKALNDVLAIHTRVGNRRGMSEAHLNLGVLEEDRGNFSAALRNFEESIRIATLISENAMQAWSYWGMGETYYRMGDYKKSGECLDKSIAFAQLVGAHEVRMLNYNTRRNLLTAQKRYKEALEYSVLGSQLHDSIHRSDLVRRFADLEKVSEIESLDRNIELLQKDRQLAQDQIQLQASKLRQQYIMLVAGFLGLILLALIAFIYYRFYARIKNLNVSITEKNSQIQAQADKLHEVNVELKRLYQEVSEQNEKIQIQADELAVSNENMSAINQSLEKIVEEKTVELRKMNDELVKHNSELLQFSYTVSHNLRAPVARMLGLADLARMEQNIDVARQWISLIRKTATDLDLIIRDLSELLDLRNSNHRQKEKVSLQEEWDRSRDLLLDGLTGTEEVVTSFDALPELMTVRAMLQSILYNLLSNAIKFRSPERGLRVFASSRIDNGKGILEVVDNGLGFDTTQHRQQLFKLYKRFHTHVAGRGLGLYLIKSQLEVLHGSIEVESRPGQGSVFRIILPLDSDDVETSGKFESENRFR